MLLVAHRGGASLQSDVHLHPRPSTGPSPAATSGQPGDSPAPSGTASTPQSTSATQNVRGTPTPATGWFTVALSAACVVPGATQTLTAHSRPGYTIAYNTRYADGRMGDSYGGYGVVPTDAAGSAVIRWTVSSAAPLGSATVTAGTGNGGPPTTLSRSFVVAAHC